MKKSKIGTPIGVKDANYREIKVGDHLVLPDNGLDVTINCYGKPISPSGAFVILTEEQLRRSYIKGVKPVMVPDDLEKKDLDLEKEDRKGYCYSELKDALDIEKEEKRDIPPLFGEERRVARFTESPSLSLEGFTDEALVTELRNRGYEVTATKTITINL